MDREALAAMLDDQQADYTRWSGPAGSVGALFQRQNRMIRILLAQPGDYLVRPLADPAAEPAAPPAVAEGDPAFSGTSGPMSDAELTFTRSHVATVGGNYADVYVKRLLATIDALAAPRPAAPRPAAPVTAEMVEVAARVLAQGRDDPDPWYREMATNMLTAALAAQQAGGQS